LHGFFPSGLPPEGGMGKALPAVKWAAIR
jgi:hypothetical protein